MTTRRNANAGAKSPGSAILGEGAMIFYIALILLGLSFLALSAAKIVCDYSHQFSKWSPHPNQNPPSLTWESIGD